MSWTYSPICDPDSSGPVLLRQRPAGDLPPAAVSRSVPHAACDWRGPSASRTAGCQWDLTDKSFFLSDLFKRKSICLSLLDIRCKESWMPEALRSARLLVFDGNEPQQVNFLSPPLLKPRNVANTEKYQENNKTQRKAESLTSERDYLVWLSKSCEVEIQKYPKYQIRKERTN